MNLLSADALLCDGSSKFSRDSWPFYCCCFQRLPQVIYRFNSKIFLNSSAKVGLDTSSVEFSSSCGTCCYIFSSASSSINAAAANIWVDILKDRFPNIREEKAARITKILGFLAGVFSIILGLLLILVGGTIVQV